MVVGDCQNFGEKWSGYLEVLELCPNLNDGFYITQLVLSYSKTVSLQNPNLY